MHPAAAALATFIDLEATDVTCHVGAWPFRLGAAADIDDLRAYAARAGLRRLWVSHLASLFGFDTRAGNAAVLDACAGDRLFAVFAVLDPSESTWREELDWALDRGAAGIRIAPSLRRHPLADAVALARACGERGVPVQLLVRLDDERVRHRMLAGDDPTPEEIAEFVRHTAGTDIVVSGLRWEGWSEVRARLSGDELDRVVLDLWHVNGPFRVFDALAAEPDRWVFGSGFPVQTPEATMLQLAASDLPAEIRRRIARTTAATLLRR